MRWDDDDFLSLPSDELSVIQLYPLDGIHGFIFHDACWHLLQKAYEPSEISLKRLLEVCKSLPVPRRGTGVCWCHDYGGLFVPNDQDYYPWEDPRRALSHSPKTRLYAKENPYSVPGIPALLMMRLEHLPEWLPTLQRHDCVSGLPWEILEAIAINLPTDDALSLCRVSKPFLPLYIAASFGRPDLSPVAIAGLYLRRGRIVIVRVG